MVACGSGPKHLPLRESCPAPAQPRLSTTILHLFIKWIPKWFVGQVILLEDWDTEAKKRNVFRKRVTCWPCRLRRQGKKARSSQNCVIVSPRCTRPPKHGWPKKHFGIPLTYVTIYVFMTKHVKKKLNKNDATILQQFRSAARPKYPEVL